MMEHAVEVTLQTKNDTKYDYFYGWLLYFQKLTFCNPNISLNFVSPFNIHNTDGKMILG